MVFALAELGRSKEGWEPFREGISVKPIYGKPGEGPAAALLRYAPGASLLAHAHSGYEHILVLAGAQQDERGVYPEGALVINAPSTRHAVTSPTGCTVLVIWERPITF
jgi:anti-sigma factor ChrR (cupin superfamily)